MPTLSVPTSSALPSSLRIPASNPGVFRILNRLSRTSLLSLVLDWLDDRNLALSEPYILAEDEEDVDQDLYPAAQSIEELREIYSELQARKGAKRVIIDRVIEGDWRDGLSLYQLAMADMQYLYDHPQSQKWTALKVVQLQGEDDDETTEEQKEKPLPNIPRFHPPSFLQNLQREILPDVKAHYNLDRPPNLPLLLLRIYMLDSPYNTFQAISNPRTTNAALDASKTIYVAFPDASPHIYVSLITTAPPAPGSSSSDTHLDTRSLRQHILEGIPKAFSKPRARYKLQSTNLAARSLESLIAKRGAGRTNSAGGGWGIYAEDDKENLKKDTPLNQQLPTPSASGDEKIEAEPTQSLGLKRRRVENDITLQKRRKLIAQSRFGSSGKIHDGKGIERLDIRLEDPFPGKNTSEEVHASLTEARSADYRHKGRRNAITEELERDSGLEGDGSAGWIPDIRLTFHGPHVFAGLRQLVEDGVVDGERMPGWMTGEDGVSVGVVRNGRIRGFKGAGL